MALTKPLSKRAMKINNAIFVFKALFLFALIGLVAYYGWIKPFRSRLADTQVVVKQP